MSDMGRCILSVVSDDASGKLVILWKQIATIARVCGCETADVVSYSVSLGVFVI